MTETESSKLNSQAEVTVLRIMINLYDFIELTDVRLSVNRCQSTEQPGNDYPRLELYLWDLQTCLSVYK